MTALIIRPGAIGDMIIISPIIKKLHEMGYEITLYTAKRGRQVFENSPWIKKYIEHDEKIPSDKYGDHVKEVRKEENPDVFIDFTESIECNVALHPIGPMYIYPKYERFAHCNRNYYDASEEWARRQFPGLSECQKLPELYFTEEEHTKAQSIPRKGVFNILWQLSGSGKQKVYPWSDYVMGEVLKNHKNIHFITTGDEQCKIIETLDDKDITHLSGEENVRTILCLTKYVDLIVSPDTGVLHASGCFDTPKIGLLGHTNRENITKYFKNDFSIEAQCSCAPCMRLIYDHQIQCPIEPISGAAWCMAEGIPPSTVYQRIDDAIRKGR